MQRRTRLSMTNKHWKHFTHSIKELRMNELLLILPFIMQRKRVIVVKFSRGIPVTSFVNVKENFLERKKQLSDNAAALLLYARLSRGEVFRHSQPVSSDLEQKQRFVERFFSILRHLDSHSCDHPFQRQPCTIFVNERLH